MGTSGFQGWRQQQDVCSNGGRRSFVTLTVKLTPEEREIALHFPHVSVARYVGRYGWVTAEVSDDETLESALEWLRESYWLKAPARLRGAVEKT